jgi:ribosomal protein L13E
VLTQAQIAHDLLGRRANLLSTTAALWLIGFPVPIEIVRKAFAHQIAGHYRRGRGYSRDGLEAGLWDHVGRFVALDARARSGSKQDEEAAALRSLTVALLELLCGVGDGVLQSGKARQWAVDTAAELMSQIETLSRLGRLKGASAIPAEQAETVEEVVTWISETASLRRQRDAVKGALPHDWTRARRLTRVAIGLLDHADATASPLHHETNRALFTSWVVAWARLLFPVVLVAMRSPEQRQSMTAMYFVASAEIRRRPIKKAAVGGLLPPPTSQY